MCLLSKKKKKEGGDLLERCKEGDGKFSVKGQVVNILGFMGCMVLQLFNTEQPKQQVNTCARLCASKSLFGKKKKGNGLDL